MLFLRKKHSMVIFQRKKNILWLFLFGYFSKKKKQNINFPILYKKSISGFIYSPYTESGFFLSTEINRIWFFSD